MLNFGEIFLLFLLNLRPSHREGPVVNNLSSLYITITKGASMYASKYGGILIFWWSRRIQEYLGGSGIVWEGPGGSGRVWEGLGGSERLLDG